MATRFTFGKAQYYIQPTETPFATKPTSIKAGVNGEVFRAKLTNAVWSHLERDAPPNCTNDYFAVKRSKPKKEVLGELERSFLQALKESNVDHAHLAVCYACFAWEGDLWIAMDIAEGHINEFMKEHPAGGGSSSDENYSGTVEFEWLLKQMQGLAGALDSIHRPGPGFIGWHHDVKPENVLYYKTNHGIEFRFIDWTTAAIRQKDPENSEIDVNGKPIGSDWTGFPAYISYETLDRPTACPTDIWSLGCVFVELFLWFDRGYEALDNESDSSPGFRQRRREKADEWREELKARIPNSYRAAEEDFDVFYNKDGTLLKMVDETIASFQKEGEANARWSSIMDMLRSMLRVDDAARITAGAVRDWLAKVLAVKEQPEEP